MRSTKFAATSLAFLFLFFFCGQPLLHAQATAGDYFYDISTKFGRGLLNVVTSPAELPCRIADDVKENPGTGAFTGLGKGVVFMLQRILVGVTEVGTFIIPAPRTIPPVCKESMV
jgi:putative exosortase-associated protein (TIGR04073 family)